MTEETKQEQKLHPMASAMFAFINEALTLEELKARLSLMTNVVKNIEADVEKLEAPTPTPAVVEEADDEAPLESDEERRARLIEEYAASL